MELIFLYSTYLLLLILKYLASYRKAYLQFLKKFPISKYQQQYLEENGIWSVVLNLPYATVTP
jgi:hypothetical protein